MADVAFVFVLIAFFALAVLFVGACDRIIGPDEATDAAKSTTEPASERAAA